MALVFRRLSNEDFAGVLALQEANLFDNLPPRGRQEGFLSARFSREQFLQMDRDVRVLVAVEDRRVVGYLCASGVDLNRQFPLVSTMIDCYRAVNFQGRALADQKTFVYGPVCVDRDHRGRGVLRGLFHALRHEIFERFDAGVGFVAEENARSLAAHVDGLGMHDVGEFEFKRKRYRILAFGGGAIAED
jgi:acetyltransferase (GNAT) family protein